MPAEGDTGISFPCYSAHCGSHTAPCFAPTLQVVIRSRLDQSMEEAQELKVNMCFLVMLSYDLFKRHTCLIAKQKGHMESTLVNSCGVLFPVCFRGNCCAVSRK